MTRYNNNNRLSPSLSLSRENDHSAPKRKGKRRRGKKRKEGKEKLRNDFNYLNFCKKRKKRKEIDLENIYIRWKDVIIRERREEMGNE